MTKDTPEPLVEVTDQGNASALQPRRHRAAVTPDDKNEAAVDDGDVAEATEDIPDDAILYEDDNEPQRCVDPPPMEDDLAERCVCHYQGQVKTHPC